MYLDSLVARGLISPDALASLFQNVNDVGNRNAPLGNTLLEGGGGRGVGGGASGRATINPDAISARLKDGKSYAEIAKEFGVSRNTVAGAVRDYGLTGQGNAPRQMISQGQLDAVREGFAQGKSGGDIANELGLNKRDRAYDRRTSVAPRDPNFETNIPDWFIEEMKQ